MPFVQEVWSVMLELAPWLFVGLAVAGLMHVFVPAELLVRHLRGRLGVLKAVAIGIPLPLCSCGVIPAGIGLKRDGASSGSAVGFLIATPQTGLDSIFVSASMLGWPFAILKVVAALVSGLAGGLIVESSEKAAATPESPIPAAHDAPRRTFRSGWLQAVDILRSIWGWLAFGILISAALTTFLPANALGSVFGDAPLLAMLAALAISLPLYVCATGSVPIAAALVASGLPLGAALVFLMAGPATNVATIGAVRRTFGGQTTLIYLGTIIVGSMAFGLLFEGLLADLFTGGAAHAHHHGIAGANLIEQLAAGLLAAAIAFFLWEDLSRHLRERRARTAAFDRALDVDGMTCQNCVMSLEKAIMAVPAIAGVSVDLASGRARVRFSPESRGAGRSGAHDQPLRAAIEGAGFDVREVVADGAPSKAACCEHPPH